MQSPYHELSMRRCSIRPTLVAGVCFPRPVDLERTCGWPYWRCAGPDAIHRLISLDSLDRIKGVGAKPFQKIVEFNPPPAMINNGKP